MTSEAVSSLQGRPSTEPQQLQVNANVVNHFSVALNDPAKPGEMFVEISYSATLKVQDSDKELLSYSAKHLCHFKVVGWIGFSEWGTIPEGALGPYFSIAAALAQRRAERTLGDMGLHGVVLPRPTNFDEYSDSKALTAA